MNNPLSTGAFEKYILLFKRYRNCDSMPCIGGLYAESNLACNMPYSAKFVVF